MAPVLSEVYSLDCLFSKKKKKKAFQKCVVAILGVSIIERHTGSLWAMARDVSALY